MSTNFWRMLELQCKAQCTDAEHEDLYQLENRVEQRGAAAE